ncbi:MAG: signal peptidase I [Clostridia bacterium]|nr:signal peptidase I [Clostridia bacterium]MDD4387067.1 signal peptidase I [Clostridia bacterium]
MKTKFLNIIKYLIFFIIISFIILVLFTRLFPRSNGLFGLKIFSVSTASMSPKLKVGDVIIVKKTDYSKIKVGDIISYEGMTSEFKDKIITHQVEQIITENDRYIYYTKGISNPILDPAVYQEQVYGVVIYKIFTVSIISRLMRNVFGFIFIVILPLAILFRSELKELKLLLKKSR